jgi:hypothetical protein
MTPLIFEAHIFTYFALFFTLFFVPVYWFYILSLEKAKRMAGITMVWGAAMCVACIFAVTKHMGPFGGLFILAAWAVPATLVWLNRSYFKGMDAKRVLFLQVFRLIGALFLVEMARGFIPGSFALPAGVGDVVVGLTTVALVRMYAYIPTGGLRLVLALGILDFTSALFFGFTSQPGPAQLFAVGFNNMANIFPTGIIPFFLVPYAIVFHVLSYITLQERNSQQ